MMDRSPRVGQTTPPSPAPTFQTPPPFPPLVLLSPNGLHECGHTPPASPPADVRSWDSTTALGAGGRGTAEVPSSLPAPHRSRPDASPGTAVSGASPVSIERPGSVMAAQQTLGAAPQAPDTPAAHDRAGSSMSRTTTLETAESPTTSTAAAIQRALDAYDGQLARIRPMLTPLEHAILDRPHQNNKDLARANNVSEHTVWERRQAFLRCGLVTTAAYGGVQENRIERQKIGEALKKRPWIESKDLAKQLNVSYPLVQSERRIKERTDQFRWALGLTDEPPAARQRPPTQVLPVWTDPRPDGTLLTVRPEDRQEVLDRLHPGATTYELLEPLERRYGPIGYSTLNRWLGL